VGTGIDLHIDESIKRKLLVKHNVECFEVAECLANVTLGYLEDTRESHKTNPPTYWFVEQTDKGRHLFVAFMFIDGQVVLKTAFDATPERQNLYRKLAS
jgi:hypothetical protein